MHMTFSQSSSKTKQSSDLSMFYSILFNFNPVFGDTVKPSNLEPILSFFFNFYIEFKRECLDYLINLIKLSFSCKTMRCKISSNIIVM